MEPKIFFPAPASAPESLIYLEIAFFDLKVVGNENGGGSGLLQMFDT